MISLACDVTSALENWARWCNRIGDCYPGCLTNWQLIQQVEYKGCHMTAEEKLREAEEHQDPDELLALRVERIVNCLDRPKRAAIRIQWVDMPDSDRPNIMTREQWDERRARFATRRAQWYFNPIMYREAVDAATEAIEGAL